MAHSNDNLNNVLGGILTGIVCGILKQNGAFSLCDPNRDAFLVINKQRLKATQLTVNDKELKNKGFSWDSNSSLLRESHVWLYLHHLIQTPYAVVAVPADAGWYMGSHKCRSFIMKQTHFFLLWTFTSRILMQVWFVRSVSTVIYGTEE